MANNKISRWIEIGDSLDGNHYAEKLDRLVGAARDAVLLLSACDDAPSKSAAAALRTILREIELPQGTQ